MISHSSSKCVYQGFSLWWAIIHAPISEPPRLTMPVIRFVVIGKFAEAWGLLKFYVNNMAGRFRVIEYK